MALVSATSKHGSVYPAVRAGYALVSARLFTIDAARPTLTLVSSSIAGRGTTFSFKAVALSAVSFQCRLNRTASSAATAGVQPVPGSALLPAWGTAVPCASPAVLSSLHTAADEACASAAVFVAASSLGMSTPFTHGQP